MSGQEKGETIADIVAEMRTGNDGGRFAYLIGRPDKYEISEPSGQMIRSYIIDKVYVSELADRIEAAWKREHGKKKCRVRTKYYTGADDPVPVHNSGIEIYEALKEIGGIMEHKGEVK